jgi:uncharacterized protein with ATP-grasp and redox domains
VKAVVDCIPCVFLQALNTSKRITTNEKKLVETQHELMKLMPTLSLDMTPAELSYLLLKEVYARFKVQDPLKSEKRRNNEVMLSLYERFEKMADYSANTMLTALKIAAAGNLIDLGIRSDIDINAFMNRVVEGSFKINDSEELFDDLKKAEKILYLADNAGEIVADKLFISSMKKNGITVAVKGSPILNDATLDDADQVGLSKVAKVISNGSGMLGTILPDCSEEFINAYNEADLIISKGQTNFESLEGVQKNIYYILTAKCPPVAECLKVEVDDAVVVKGEPAKRKKELSAGADTRKER